MSAPWVVKAAADDVSAAEGNVTSCSCALSSDTFWPLRPFWCSPEMVRGGRGGGGKGEINRVCARNVLPASSPSGRGGEKQERVGHERVTGTNTASGFL